METEKANTDADGPADRREHTCTNHADIEGDGQAQRPAGTCEPGRLLRQPPRDRRRRFLVFTSAGDRSNVSMWAGPSRCFDIWVVYYGDEVGTAAFDGAEYLAHGKGAKFQNLLRAYRQYKPLLAAYEAILVCDDDIVLRPDGFDKLFELHERYDLWISQPAFDSKGKISHRLTRVDYSCVLRWTTFVEMTCPLFRTDKLFKFLDVYDPRLVGWGTDWWFLQVVGGAKERRIAVVDLVPCVNPPDRAKKGGGREIDTLQSTDERRGIWQAVRNEYGLVGEGMVQLEIGRVRRDIWHWIRGSIWNVLVRVAKRLRIH